MAGVDGDYVNLTSADRIELVDFGPARGNDLIIFQEEKKTGRIKPWLVHSNSQCFQVPSALLWVVGECGVVLSQPSISIEFGAKTPDLNARCVEVLV